MIKLLLAPLAGVTDWPFRSLCFEQGADAACTEMVSAMGYLCAPKGQHATEDLLVRGRDDKVLSLQLFGKDPDVIAEAARRLSGTGSYDAVDINMGCPVHKVAASGEGSGLMRTPEKAYGILSAAVKASSVPVTVKFRLGWDEKSINVVQMARMAEEAGVSAVAVHGRTRMQMYGGKADWEKIAEVKQAVHIPVYGNGDIFTPEDAIRNLKASGVDGLMIARGAMGNPWLFRQIREAMEGKTVYQPSPDEKIAMIRKHYSLLLGWKPETIAVKEMRKHIGWYLHGMRGAAQMRSKINGLNRPEDVLEALDAFGRQQRMEES